MTEVLFFILSIIAVLCALMVIISRNPIYSALFLVVTFFCLAVIFLLLEAYFLAAVQVIVYAGAIMVLFLFVIMLLNLQKEDSFLTAAQPRTVLGFGLASVFSVIVIMGVVASVGRLAGLEPDAAQIGSPAGVGRVLFTKYLLPFEIASLLLLVALVGAVILAKRSMDK